MTTTVNGGELKFGAGIAEQLPAPSLDGPVALYKDVLPGVDVKVEVRSTGFEQLWIANSRAALERLLDRQPDGQQGVSASLDADGLHATPQKDGSLSIASAAAVPASTIAAPTAWDAALAPDGTPASEVQANLDLVVGNSVVADKQAATGDLGLAVSVDQRWLDDPQRQYPITIDPTYSVGTDQRPIFDTYVKEGATTDRSDSTYLPVGYGFDNVKNRSFLTFDTDEFRGATVDSASLSLWADDAGTCTPSGWSSYAAGIATTSSRWSSQPALSTKYATSTQTKGFNSNCAAGLVTIDMRDQVQAWADSTSDSTAIGMALKADGETSVSGYHRFWSSDAASNKPVLRWTWIDPDAEEIADSPTDPFTVDPDAPSEDNTSATGESYPTYDQQKINPKWWYLIVVNKSDAAMWVCRNWNPCPSSQFPKTYLPDNHNTKTDFDWNDTDGVYTPAYRQIKADQKGTNPVLCVAHRYGYWCKVSPRAYKTGGDYRNFYYHRVANPYN